MRNLIKFACSVFLLVCFSISCNNTAENRQPEINTKDIEEPLLNANKQAMITEDQQIDNYITRHQWKMNKTGSGLRYAIYKNGNGPKAVSGKIARLNYTVNLISGEEIYSSKNDGIKEFLIGKGGVESGLEEGILLMRVGDHAKFIIPSHLGFGLIGDQVKVPPKSTLIYDIELLDLK